ncbi:M20/M25/M40 family metallo-hydrolase [Paludisphaera soli]|uniref:M20/M25/M40 family metallo-hydrolase n=1 Tax=Paludisphaera soli TaxID=2712865 RepID=UPI001F0DC8D4|nr:M20/M25/M40 family metallo-hydrolase [Paludisphaera soli]
MLRIRGTALALAAVGLLGIIPRSSAQAPVPTPPAQAEAKTDDAPKPAGEGEAKPETPKPPADPIDRIKEEGEKRSEVMATLSTLTDVIGPRLTGSPALKRANEWTRDALTKWGLENAHLEPWGPFGRGWTLKRFSAQVTEPQCIPLIAVPKAWSPSLDGVLTAEVVHLDVKTEADFERYKGKLQGKIVLTGPTPDVPARFEPLASRKTDKELLDLADAAEPGAGRGGRPRPPAPPASPPAEPAAPGVPPATAATPPPAPARTFPADMRAQMELASKRQRFLAGEGPALLIDPSRSGDGGTLFVQSASIPGPPPGEPRGEGAAPLPRRVSVWEKDAPKAIPQLVMAKEHYNRLVRMLAKGETLKMTVELAVEFHEEDLNAYNTVAEIPGTDLKDEIVMLGGHLDSWHGGTGATDNAAGCAVGMEAVRILKALDLKPRRTIRLALWTGEEQGIFGSKAYVDEHFRKRPERQGLGGPGPDAPEATAEDKEETKPEYEKLSAYYNLDNGTGKIRGVYLQGNEAVRPIFRKWLQPFREMGAQTLSIANTGGTDHLPFDAVGLPGFQFIQDEVEYDTRTHHSNMDVYDRAQADDLKQASIIMAAFVYNTAMLDEKLPRKPARTPARPEVRAAAVAAP